MLNLQSYGMKRFRVTHMVLGLLCLMYFITYLDRVNVSTAAVGNKQRGRGTEMRCLSVKKVVSGQRGKRPE